jgi:hypothetical protein
VPVRLGEYGIRVATAPFRAPSALITEEITMKPCLYGAKTRSRRQDILLNYTTDTVATVNPKVARRRRDR